MIKRAEFALLSSRFYQHHAIGIDFNIIYSNEIMSMHEYSTYVTTEHI